MLEVFLVLNSFIIGIAGLAELPLYCSFMLVDIKRN